MPNSQDFESDYTVTHEGHYDHFVTENTVAVMTFKMTGVYTTTDPFKAHRAAHEELVKIFPVLGNLYVDGFHVKLTEDA